MHRKHMAEDLERLNFGYVYAAIHNCAPYGDPKREPMQPTEIVPRLKPEPVDMTKMSPKAQKNYLFWIFQGSGKSNFKK